MGVILRRLATKQLLKQSKKVKDVDSGSPLTIEGVQFIGEIGKFLIKIGKDAIF